MARQSIQKAKSMRRAPTALERLGTLDDLEALHKIAQEGIKSAIDTQQRFSELRAQFHAIVQEQGGHGEASRLARIGRVVSTEYEAAAQARFENLRDAMRDANVPDASEFAS